MNLIDCEVTKVLGEPYRRFGYWWVDIEYDGIGVSGYASLMFSTKEAAAKVGVGHVFLG
ncbi:hypothetical protein AH02_18 [Pseudomonas phage AH02]|nr:hypothetical protein AH02_18 [Pseudomonas phage AH02]